MTPLQPLQKSSDQPAAVIAPQKRKQNKPSFSNYIEVVSIQMLSLRTIKQDEDTFRGFWKPFTARSARERKIANIEEYLKNRKVPNYSTDGKVQRILNNHYDLADFDLSDLRPLSTPRKRYMAFLKDADPRATRFLIDYAKQRGFIEASKANR